MVKYANMVPGIFRNRPNRFIAQVEIQGQMQTVHVKNTGRCRELLIPGARVWCQQASNPNRKTPYDLIAVEKGERLINMDSQAPNTVAGEWLASGGLGAVENLRPETVHGDSRFDFSFTREGKPCFLEVKGVTLEENGICAFPDAPTQRGAKHLRGLIRARQEGCGAYVLFVIQIRNRFSSQRCHRPGLCRRPPGGRCRRRGNSGHGLRRHPGFSGNPQSRAGASFRLVSFPGLCYTVRKNWRIVPWITAPRQRNCF